nr:fimbria/pilus outer membrane usher protein [uncultured Enterobacter sp.]
MSSISVPRRFVLSGLTLALMAAMPPARAEDEFNLRALELDSPLENSPALRNFLANNALLPGVYLTSIMWGQEFLIKKNITFVLSPDKKQLLPQFTKTDLRGLGVDVDAIPALSEHAEGEVLGDIADYLAEARYDFRTDSQTLYLHIPQRYQDRQAKGSIDASQWDDGVPAAWVSYYASGSQQRTDNVEQNSQWLNLNSGTNIGPWRLRNSSTWSDTDSWSSLSTTLSRDIKFLKSQLEMGQTYTNGELFDSVQMTGAKLETDTNMLPNSLQGFAPVVRGIANGDAKVTITQNGYTLYQTYVSAGPFEIRDLSQVASGVDLEVTVEEADGSEHSFIQASSSVPILQREGGMKFSLAGGKYRDSGGGEEPGFGQGTLIYGLPHGITTYGGILSSSIYRAGLLGLGADLQQLGSLSVDVTAARTSFDDGRDDEDGVSWRAQYAKDFPATNTALTLASYRYSTSGFYTFQEAIDQRDTDLTDGIYSYRQINNRRSRLQLNVSQTLGEWGTLYVNAYQQDYWDLDGYERSANLGYSTNWGSVTWSVNYSLTKTPMSDDDQQVALMVNVPLSRWLSNAWATYSINSTKNGSTTHQSGVGGTALEDNNLSYNLQQSYTNKDVGYGASMSTRYRSSMGEFGVGYNYGKDYHQWNYNAQGAIVAHGEGVTLGQSVRDAFAIVHVEDGAGIEMQNAQGVYTDYFGNAIVPMLSHYRRNAIGVNTQNRDDIDIQDAVKEVVPTKGAAIAVTFDARVGQRVLLTLTHNQRVVPFGALLTLDKTTSIVGEAGEVYLTGVDDGMTFAVQWGSEPDQRCEGTVTIPQGSTQAIYRASALCR